MLTGWVRPTPHHVQLLPIHRGHRLVSHLLDQESPQGRTCGPSCDLALTLPHQLPASCGAKIRTEGCAGKADEQCMT
jgi:hypothetical protein